MESWLQVKHLSNPQAVPSASRSWRDSAKTSRGLKERRQVPGARRLVLIMKADSRGQVLEELNVDVKWEVVSFFFQKAKECQGTLQRWAVQVQQLQATYALSKFEFIKIEYNLEFQFLSHISHISSAQWLRETGVYYSGWSRQNVPIIAGSSVGQSYYREFQPEGQEAWMQWFWH